MKSFLVTLHGLHIRKIIAVKTLQGGGVPVAFPLKGEISEKKNYKIKIKIEQKKWKTIQQWKENPFQIQPGFTHITVLSIMNMHKK